MVVASMFVVGMRMRMRRIGQAPRLGVRRRFPFAGMLCVIVLRVIVIGIPVGVLALQETDGGGCGNSQQQGRGQRNAVVRVEFHFWQQVAQGNT